MNMPREKKKWMSTSEQELQTLSNRSKINAVKRLADKLTYDTEVIRRKEEQLCKWCFYQVQGAIASETEGECGSCKIEMVFGNSNVDRLCKECAFLMGSCKHCGGLMD